MPPIRGEAVWTDEMKKIFGSDEEGVPAILTVEQMRKAMITLFWFRESLGLEFAVMYDIPFYDPIEYSMCTENTQALATIYTWDYLSGLCCNDSYINLPPMIERL